MSSPHHCLDFTASWPLLPASVSGTVLDSISHGSVQVYLASAMGTLRRDLPRACVIKVVNLGAGCKIRDDYKPILRSEGLALQRFRFPGFVQCYACWGSAPPLGQPCASTTSTNPLPCCGTSARVSQMSARVKWPSGTLMACERIHTCGKQHREVRR